MAQATTGRTLNERTDWSGQLKLWLGRAVIAAVGFMVGYWIVAPMQAARQPDRLSTSFLALPLGAVSVTSLDGTSVVLPVRIADTSTARNAGLSGVGESALENQFVLYGLTRESSSRTSYSIKDVRAPLDFAAIDAQGNVTAVERAPTGGERVTVAAPHMWLLVAKAGALERYGIGVGATLEPESIRKF